MFVEGEDALKGYWCVMAPSVTMQTAEGKKFLSAEMHISKNMARTGNTSGSAVEDSICPCLLLFVELLMLLVCAGVNAFAAVSIMSCHAV